MESDAMKKIIKYVDKPLLIVSVLLFIIGLIMVFSASNVTAYMSHEVSPYNYFIKQAFFFRSRTYHVTHHDKIHHESIWSILLGTIINNYCKFTDAISHRTSKKQSNFLV